MNLRRVFQWVAVLIATFVVLNCAKKKEDNSGLALLGLSGLTTSSECDRTEKDCVISLIKDKTWYAVGSRQIPRNVLGYKEATIAAFGQVACFSAVKVEASAGSGGNDLTFKTYNKPGTVSGSTCDEDTASGDFGPAFTSTVLTITPRTADCFDIDITYDNVNQEGRGSINADGTILKFELYLKGTPNPVGHRCADGQVGQRNATLIPDTNSCSNPNTSLFVCNPASDPLYNNVQEYNFLTE
jgi:hypothetical protein